VWIARSDCKVCKKTYADYEEAGYDLKPPCYKCFPGVHPYNKAIYEVYSVCSGQLIIGPGGAVAVNMLAVAEILKTRDVGKNYIEAFHSNVQILAGTVINEYNKMAKEKEQHKK